MTYLKEYELLFLLGWFKLLSGPGPAELESRGLGEIDDDLWWALRVLCREDILMGSGFSSMLPPQSVVLFSVISCKLK